MLFVYAYRRLTISILYYLIFTNDGIFGSVFYISTSLRRIHAIVGIVSLFIYLLRYYLHRFSRDHHIGLELTFCSILAFYWFYLTFLLYLLI